MNPQTYLRHRRIFEAGFWLALATINSVANSVTVNIDLGRMGTDHAGWEPWVWEMSSAVTWLVLVLVIVRFNQRFPLERPNPPRYFLYHLAFTLPVSLLHVVGMVALREIAYWWMDGNYSFGPWLDGIAYEYIKDARTYAGFLVFIYLYRFLLRRWQGEAEFLSEGREEEPPEPVSDRFLVKKLGREFLVKVRDIDWIESAGNYVTLHVGERLYPLRETMAGIEQKLAGQGFARVHRGAILNLDRVKEIEPFDTGDARAHLFSGGIVPVSRRYRQVLKEKLR